MVYPGMPWYTILCNGMSWYTMVYHGVPWYTMAYHGKPWDQVALAGARDLPSTHAGGQDDVSFRRTPQNKVNSKSDKMQPNKDGVTATCQG